MAAGPSRAQDEESDKMVRGSETHLIFGVLVNLCLDANRLSKASDTAVRK